MNAVILRSKTGNGIDKMLFTVESLTEFRQMCEDYSYPKWCGYWEMWVFNF